MGMIKNYIKMGFGLGTGVFLAQILFILLGLAFFLPGLMLVKNSNKGESQEKQTSYYGGIALMVVGVAIMGGLGFGFLVDSIDF